MKDLIYNQNDIPKNKWRYGFRSSAAVGCGWVAVYNALRLLGYRAEPEELITFFEMQLPLIHGNAGTTIPAPALFFRSRGFPVEITARKDKFDELARRSDVCILYYLWRNRWKFGAHFVTLHRTEDGFVGYNTYTNSSGPDDYGPSVSGFLKKRGYFCPVLTGIRDKRKPD